MSESAGSWTEVPASEPVSGLVLPPSVRRAQAVEEQAQRRQARAAERTQAERAERAQERAWAAAREQALARGEDVPALALVTGQGLGRTIGEVFAGIRPDPVRDMGQRGRDWDWIDGPEPRIHASRSSGWPASEFEAARMVSQAEENSRWLVAYRARHNYPAAAEAARAKAAGGGQVSRSHSGYASYGEITRVCGPGDDGGLVNYAPEIYR